MKKIVYIIFVFSLFILNVYASDELKVGENFYSDMQSAITEASNTNKPIELQTDFLANEIEISADQKITIDLNNYKLTTKLILKNYGELTIQYGTIQNSGAVSYFIGNYQNAILNLKNVNIIDDNYAYCLKNSGKAEFTNVTLDKKSFVFENESIGFLTLNNCNIKTTYDMLINKGKLIINDGEYVITASSSLNFLYGETIINGGTFKSSDINTFFKINAPAKLIINNATFEGGTGIEISCRNAPNKCDGKAEVIINNATMNLKKEIINVAALADYITQIPEITINGGNFNSTTNGNFISFHNPAIINLYGGNFVATNSTGYLTYLDEHDTTLIIGKNDGNVSADSLLLNVPLASLNRTSTNHKLNFYNGTIILKKELKYVKGLPEGYQICYEPYEGALKATLQKEGSCSWTPTDTNTTTNNNNNNNNKDADHNPQTGAFLPIAMIILFMISGLYIYKYTNKNKKFNKI